MSDAIGGDMEADWQRRVVGRSLQHAAARSVDRGTALVRAAATVLERSNGDDITVQEVADEAGQSLRTLYQYFSSKDDLLLAVFEEAMRTYASLVRRAIDGFDDPLDRLAGAMLAASRMPEVSGSGIERGLSRLRLKLAEAQPELIGRAQLAMSGLVRELIDAAVASGDVVVDDVESATFMLLSLNGSYITAEALGNDAGVRRPDVFGLVSFCLLGLGASLDEARLRGINAGLVLPKPASSKRATPKKRPAKKR